MNEVELDFIPWLSKINEKLTFAILNIKEHRDISEEDYAIFGRLHRIWFNGEHPLFKSQMEGVPENVTQNLLFGETTDKTSDTKTQNTDGTEVDILTSETIKTDNNE
jgi:hypothetical protein